MSLLSRIEPTLGGLEEEYRSHFLKDDVTFAGIALFLASLFVIGAVRNDHLFFGTSQQFWLLVAFRAVFVISATVPIFLLQRLDKPVTCDRIVLIVLLVCATCLAYIHYTRPPAYQTNFFRIMLAIVGIYILYPNPLSSRAIPAFLLSICVIIMAGFDRASHSPQWLSSIVFAAFAANAVGIVFSSRWNRLRRGLFKAMIESKRAENALRESEEALRTGEARFRRIYEEAPVMMHSIDKSGIVRNVNTKWLDEMGYARDEVLGKKIIDFMAPASCDFLTEVLPRFWKEGKISGLPYQYIKKDGSVIDVVLNSVVTEDPSFGQISLSAVNDITDRKRAEEALRKSEHLMRLVADNSPAYIAYVGMEDLRYHFVNQKFEWGFGIPREEILGKHIREVIGESNYQFALKYIEEVKSGVPAAYVNTFNLEQGKRWVHVNYVPDFDEHDRVKGIVVFSYDVTETKSAEERLRDSERRLAEIIEFLPDPTFAIDTNGRVIIWNKAVEQLTGIQAEDMLGKGDYEYAIPFYGERRPVLVDLVLERNRDIEQRYLEIREEGTKTLVSESYHPRLKENGAFIWATATPLYDSEGNVVGAIESLKDITDRKRTEDALKESQEQFSLFMDMLPHRVFIKDESHKVLYANQYVKDLFYGDRWIGKDAFEALPGNPKLAQAMHDGDCRALAEGQITLEEEMPDSTGKEHVFETTKFRIERGDKPPLLGGLGLDITDRVRAREALRLSEEQYKTLYKEAKKTEEMYHSLLNSTLDAIVSYDLEGRVTYVNNGFTSTFGWVKEELAQGVPYTPESEREVTMHNVMRVIRDGSALKDFETMRFTKAGDLIDVSISASRFNDHEGNPAGMLVILRDITERKLAEKNLAEALETAEQLRDEAQAANRAKSEFVANMSHEIRTPMNAIMGMTDLALRSDLSPKLKDYLTKIRTSSQSLLRIINDILDFSKIEAGHLDLESVRFDLRNVISNMSDVVSANDACRDIEFLVSLDPAVPCGLVGDPLRLEQVLTNLANNAVKFTSSGEVLVRVECAESHRDRVSLKFSVRDTGIGIPGDKLDALFNPFTQADGSTTRQFGGSGLGLTICRRLINMMGGEIQAQSEPGKGSIFSFQLEFPVQPDHEARPLPTPADVHGMRVLVVDDNAMSREILLEMLKSFSFQAVTVSSGIAAIEELIASHQNNPYDLVLLDWRMPGIDGIETARRIDKEDRLSGRIPKIIMITAFGTDEVKIQAKEAGLDAFLSKPVQPSLLLDTIMDLFGKAGPRISRAAQAKEREALGTPNIRGARILIAEDNEINQQVAKEILEYAGAFVRIAWNGREAVEALNESEFDAVLMDIQMPEMDGYEATRVIRSDDRFKNLPIIAMTAHAMTGDRERCLNEGMNDHVAKPIDSDNLLFTLAEWMQRAGIKIQEPPTGQPISRPDDEVELPEDVPGVDIESALRRLRGNRRVLKRLLRTFVQNHGDAARQIREALEADKLGEAQIAAHTLKGASGNISATSLHLATTRLDEALRARNREASQRLLVDVEQSLDELVTTVNALFPLGEEGEREETPISDDSRIQAIERLAPALKELAGLLGAYDAKALDTFHALKPQLDRCGIDEGVAELNSFLDTYNLKGALGVLNRIAEQLGIPLKVIAHREEQ